MKKFYLNENEEAVFKINGKEVTVSKLTVGPTDAEEIISKSDALFSNRKSREKSYKLYSEDMNRGEWKTNGETIKFSADGALLDGRNRLCAVTLGDTKIDFLAVGNVDRDVVDTIDIGMKRTLEHALKMQSSSYETGSASIVKMKLELDSRQMSQEASEVALGISRIDAVHEYENNIGFYNISCKVEDDIFFIEDFYEECKLAENEIVFVDLLNYGYKQAEIMEKLKIEKIEYKKLLKNIRKKIKNNYIFENV